MATTEARLAVRGAELEVALGEVDAVLAMVPPGEYRERLEELREQLAGEGPSGDGVARARPPPRDRAPVGPAAGRLRARWRERRDAALPQAAERPGARVERERGQRRAPLPLGTGARRRRRDRERPRRVRSRADRGWQGDRRQARPARRPTPLRGRLTCPRSTTTWRASTSRAGACSSSAADGSRSRR